MVVVNVKEQFTSHESNNKFLHFNDRKTIFSSQIIWLINVTVNLSRNYNVMIFTMPINNFRNKKKTRRRTE